MTNKEIMVNHLEDCLVWIDENISPRLIGSLKVYWADESGEVYEFTVNSNKKVQYVRYTNKIEIPFFYRENYSKESHTHYLYDLDDNCLLSFLKEWPSNKTYLQNKIKNDELVISEFKV